MAECGCDCAQTIATDIKWFEVASASALKTEGDMSLRLALVGIKMWKKAMAHVQDLKASGRQLARVRRWELLYPDAGIHFEPYLVLCDKVVAEHAKAVKHISATAASRGLRLARKALEDFLDFCENSCMDVGCSSDLKEAGLVEFMNNLMDEERKASRVLTREQKKASADANREDDVAAIGDLIIRLGNIKDHCGMWVYTRYRANTGDHHQL